MLPLRPHDLIPSDYISYGGLKQQVNPANIRQLTRASRTMLTKILPLDYSMLFKDGTPPNNTY